MGGCPDCGKNPLEGALSRDHPTLSGDNLCWVGECKYCGKVLHEVHAKQQPIWDPKKEEYRYGVYICDPENGSEILC